MVFTTDRESAKVKAFRRSFDREAICSWNPLELILNSNCNRNQITNRTEVKTMDDLPELPFEKVLSYLSLEDRLKARAVSRAWREKFDSYPVKTLCYSSRPAGFIFGKSRLVSGAFARNFIGSTRFATFFNTFHRSTLSNLKHLRLCDIRLNEENQAAFARTLNSFGQLEQLDIIRVDLVVFSSLSPEIELNLPMLTSLQLERMSGFQGLTLNAPALKRVRLLEYSPLRLHLVHVESVEWLFTNNMHHLEVKKLKKLKYFYFDYINEIVDSTFLADLQDLKEIHLQHSNRDVKELFEQKQRLGRADLKIFWLGLLLDGNEDERLMNHRYLDDEVFAQFSESSSRLADVIPFCGYLRYDLIERVAPESQLDILNRFVDLKLFIVSEPVQDIDRFLDLLGKFRHIAELQFCCAQPQELFDRLPEYCAVQRLSLSRELPDVRFLFKLKHLIRLDLSHVYPSNVELIIRETFEELPFFSCLDFGYHQQGEVTKRFSIEKHFRNRFLIWIDPNEFIVSNLDSVIQRITNLK